MAWSFWSISAELSTSVSTSHSALIAFFACMACQVVSAITTTLSDGDMLAPQLASSEASSIRALAPIVRTCSTPGIPSASVASKDFNLMPNARGRSTLAYTMPSTWWSSPNRGLPLMILSMSTLALPVPMMVNEAGSFNSTSSGISRPAASFTSSP